MVQGDSERYPATSAGSTDPNGGNPQPLDMAYFRERLIDIEREKLAVQTALVLWEEVQRLREENRMMETALGGLRESAIRAAEPAG